jgi:putative ABC transport system permease protein
MACMLIMQYVMHEFSYDDFHVKNDRIFRIQQDRYNKGELSTRWAAGNSGIGLDLKSYFPEVERYVRLHGTNAILSAADRYFREDALYYASEDFFQVFSVKLIAGEDSSLLKDPFKIVLSQSLAKKYFGKDDPIGKIVSSSDHDVDYQVTGVFEDLPVNTHMKIDALMSLTSLQKLLDDPLTSWEWDGFLTYILLNEKTDANALEAKLPAFVEKQAGEQLKKTGASMEFHLQPLTSIHLDSNFIGEFKPNGNRQSTYFLSIVAILILVIAWINFINLSTAKSIERAREVGVRKVVGGFRSQLIQQFLFESLLLNTMAFAIAIVFVVLLTPFFSELTGRELDYLLSKQNSFWIWIGVFIFGGALLSGIYPAFVLSSYKPAEILKGRFKNTSSGVRFRKGMVVVQFVSSITLMVGAFTIDRQIRFMQEQELGVNINQTLVLPSPDVIDGTIDQKFQVFKQQIEQYPEVVSVSASSDVPGHKPGTNVRGVRSLSQQDVDSKQYGAIWMNHDFIEAYGLTVIQGRGFSGDVVIERGNVMINESAVSLMGFKKPEDAINDQILFSGDTLRIVGVLRNYHQESLKQAFEPLIFRYHPGAFGFYSIKFNTSSVKTSLSSFEKEWKAVFPGNPFIHFFLDDHYNQQYQADQQFGKVFGLFSSLAIFIACLGLFGLSSLTVIQRTKEIGVRKVLGASIPDIVATISRDYVLLMVVAIVLSVPFAWWIMAEWLSNFAYKIPLTWWIFAIPGFAVIAIAMLTVSVHTIKAARTNPVKSLRYE